MPMSVGNGDTLYKLSDRTVIVRNRAPERTELRKRLEEEGLHPRIINDIIREEYGRLQIMTVYQGRCI